MFIVFEAEGKPIQRTSISSTTTQFKAIGDSHENHGLAIPFEEGDRLIPIVKEFWSEKPLKEEITRLSEQGETKKDLYIMSHDENLAKDVAKKTDANQMDLKEDSLGSQAVNLFRGESNVIRHRFKELGFSQSEADQFDKKLEAGKLLLIIGDHKDTRGGA